MVVGGGGGGGGGVIPLKKYSIIGGARNVTKYNQQAENIDELELQQIIILRIFPDRIEPMQ